MSFVTEEHFIVEQYAQSHVAVEQKEAEQTEKEDGDQDKQKQGSEGWAIFTADGVEIQLNLKQMVENERKENADNAEPQDDNDAEQFFIGKSEPLVAWCSRNSEGFSNISAALRSSDYTTIKLSNSFPVATWKNPVCGDFCSFASCFFRHGSSSSGSFLSPYCVGKAQPDHQLLCHQLAGGLGRVSAFLYEIYSNVKKDLEATDDVSQIMDGRARYLQYCVTPLSPLSRLLSPDS